VWPAPEWTTLESLRRAEQSAPELRVWVSFRTHRIQSPALMMPPLKAISMSVLWNAQTSDADEPCAMER
jgi:hypothetical protein